MKALVILAVKRVYVKLALLVSAVHPLIEAFEVIAFFIPKTKKPLEKKVEQQFSLPGLALAVVVIVLLRGIRR